MGGAIRNRWFVCHIRIVDLWISSWYSETSNPPASVLPAGPAGDVAPPALAPRQWRVFWVEHQPRAAGKVQLQGVILRFSGGGSLRWDLSAFDPALRETRLSQSHTAVSPSSAWSIRFNRLEALIFS